MLSQGVRDPPCTQLHRFQGANVSLVGSCMRPGWASTRNAGVPGRRSNHWAMWPGAGHVWIRPHLDPAAPGAAPCRAWSLCGHLLLPPATWSWVLVTTTELEGGVSCASLRDREWGSSGRAQPRASLARMQGPPGAPPPALSGQGCTVGSEGTSGLEGGGDLPPFQPRARGFCSPNVCFKIEVTEFLRQVI